MSRWLRWGRQRKKKIISEIMFIKYNFHFFRSMVNIHWLRFYLLIWVMCFIVSTKWIFMWVKWVIFIAMNNVFTLLNSFMKYPINKAWILRGHVVFLLSFAMGIICVMVNLRHPYLKHPKAEPWTDKAESQVSAGCKV